MWERAIALNIPERVELLPSTNSLLEMRAGIKLRLRVNLILILLLSILLSACGESKITVKEPTISTNPSPKAEPEPNQLLVGSDTDPLATITRYQSSSTDKLQEITLHKDVSAELATVFAGAATLTLAGGTPSNSYTIRFNPTVQQILDNKTASLMPAGKFSNYAVAMDNTTGKILGLGKQIPVVSLVLGPGAMVFNLAAGILADQFMPSINDQFEILNRNVTDIKNFLQDNEYGQLEGNLKYLNDIRAVLNQHKISPNDLESFRIQLEAVERESRQTLSSLQAQMTRTSDSFKQVKLDKTLFFFRSEDKVKELEKYIGDYQRQASNYLFALMVRGLDSQVRCALPESRDIALTRIADVRNDLKTWLQQQNEFYSAVEKRVPEMDGLFADSKTQGPVSYTHLTLPTKRIV